MKHYLDLINHFFFINPLFFLVSLNIFILCLLSLIVYITFIVLDGLYQKDVNQRPKHFLWDFLVSVVVLIVPSILVFTVRKDYLSIFD